MCQIAGRLGASVTRFSSSVWIKFEEFVSAIVQSKEYFKLDNRKSGTARGGVNCFQCFFPLSIRNAYLEFGFPVGPALIYG